MPNTIADATGPSGVPEPLPLLPVYVPPPDVPPEDPPEDPPVECEVPPLL
jgi:hypothetical protein